MLSYRSNTRISAILLGCVILLTIEGRSIQSDATQGSTAGQQQPQTQVTPQQAPTPDNGGLQQDDSYVAPILPERSIEHSGVQELGGHQNWFSNNFDWFHWGPVGITSAELFYTYAEQDANGGTSHQSVGVFQTNIAFSRKMRHSWIILQYEPRVLYIDGKFTHPISNQDSTLDLFFEPFSHFTIGLAETFNYYGGQNTLNDRTLSINQFTGAITNPFLNNGNSTIANSVGIPVAYSFSAKTTASVSPFFNYLQSSSDGTQVAPGTPLINENMFQYGVRTSLNHLFSASSSIGMFYSYQVNRQDTFNSTIDFQSFGLSASHRFGRSLVATVNLGASYANDVPGGTWTGVGSVTLNRSFRHSSLQAMAGRDANFTGLFGTQYSNYAWANYSHDLGRRADFAAGFGYLSGAIGQSTTSGKYYTARINYKLRPNVGWFFGYVRYQQSDNSGQLNIGNQSQFQMGLQWAPGRRIRL